MGVQCSTPCCSNPNDLVVDKQGDVSGLALITPLDKASVNDGLPLGFSASKLEAGQSDASVIVPAAAFSLSGGTTPSAGLRTDASPDSPLHQVSVETVGVWSQPTGGSADFPIEQAALLASVDDLANRKEWAEAEAVLLKALDELPADTQRTLWESLSGNPSVTETLARSKLLEAARLTLPESVDALGARASQASKSSKDGDRAASLGFPGWNVMPAVKVDLKKLFPDSPADYGSHIKSEALILWRQDDHFLQIKVVGEAPAQHPRLPKSFPMALTAMVSEVDLMTFNPMFTEMPNFLDEPKLDFATWREQTRIRFLVSDVALQEMNRMFTPEGVIVLVTDKVNDENDPRMKQARVPKGYTLAKGDEAKDRFIHVFFCGEDRFSYVSTCFVPLTSGKKINSWILNTILGWLFPTILRKMFDTAALIFENPEYTKRFEKDEVGLYGRFAKAEAEARRRERESGQKIQVHSSKDRPNQEGYSFGKLAQRVASFQS